MNKQNVINPKPQKWVAALKRTVSNALAKPLPRLLPEPHPHVRQQMQHMLRSQLQQRTALYAQLTERVRPRIRGDVAHWRQALATAQHPTRPDPRPLQALYEDALLDAHLASIVNTRRLRVLGTPYSLQPHAGTADAGATTLLQQGWFTALLGHVMDSLFYGHSLIELVHTDAGDVQALCIPRGNVLPHQGLVALDAHAPAPESDTDKILTHYVPIAEAPHLLISVESGTHGAGHALGLLLQAVPLVLAKRNALASWGEFAEVFGMPLRIGRTNTRDERRRAELTEMLKGMGSAAYAVLDENDHIEFAENSKGDAYRVYDQLMERVNLELSKLINGQTLTTEPGDRGARALGTVHDNLYDDITRADLRWVQQVVNAQVLPRLAQLDGYAHVASGYTFAFAQAQAVLSPAEQWSIDAGLLQHYRLDAQYLMQKYGSVIVGER